MALAAFGNPSIIRGPGRAGWRGIASWATATMAVGVLAVGGYVMGTAGPAATPPAAPASRDTATLELRGASSDEPLRLSLPANAVIDAIADLRARQSRLGDRQRRIAALMDAATARSIEVTPAEPPKVIWGRPVVYTALEGARIGPVPVTGEDAVLSLDRGLPASLRKARELDRALTALENAQDALLRGLDNALERRLAALAKIPAELGLAAPERDAGGPLFELRGVEAPLAPLDPLESVRLSLDQYDEMRATVDALPVRAPLAGELRQSSRYGRRVDPFLKRPAMHTGLDFAARRGTPVLATASGVVRFADWNGGYGRMIEIDHGNGHRTRYGHLSKIDVAAGQRVEAGQRIGKVGSSGRSTGPHLHYEVVRDGRRRDPAPYVALARRGTAI